MQGLDPLRPNYVAAQVYATLVLQESVEELAKEIQLVSRR
jgi:hypothetical protein